MRLFSTSAIRRGDELTGAPRGPEGPATPTGPGSPYNRERDRRSHGSHATDTLGQNTQIYGKSETYGFLLFPTIMFTSENL